jgi:Arc/MetJ-type ribon-helix-helix transcriptional regulator
MKYDKKPHGDEMEKRIIFRLPDSLYEATTTALNEGKAKSLSDLLRKALKQWIEGQTNASE